MTADDTAVTHPLVDAVGETWTATESRADVVRLTAGRIDFLRRCREAGRHAVQITDEYSYLSPAFAAFWRDGGGRWAIREPDGGLRDGFTGRRVRDLDDLATSSAVRSIDELSKRSLAPRQPDDVIVRIEAAVRHRARETTLLGRLADDVTKATTGRALTAWGAHEPAITAWDRREFTQFAKDCMPDDCHVVVGGPAVTGTITARRTRHGVEELISLQCATGTPSTIDHQERRERIAATLADLASREQPLITLVFAVPGYSSLTIAPSVPLTPTPELLLIGAPAVRSLRLDIAAHLQTHGAERVGRPRVPALLYRLGSLGDATWPTLDRILADIDADALADALSTEGPHLLDLHPNPEGTDHGEP